MIQRHNNNSHLIPHSDSPKILPNGLTAISNGLKAHNNTPIAINLSTSDGISPALLNATNAAAAMPLNLNVNAVHQQQPSTNGFGATTQPQSLRTAVTSNGLQIISSSSTTSNSNNSTPTVINGKNGFRSHSESNSKEQMKKLESHSTSSEPPTKVIKLINSNGITLASVDKDSKLISSGPLQVVVSQIPLLTPTPTLRVIGPAPNGVATIELSNSNGNLSNAFNNDSNASF